MKYYLLQLLPTRKYLFLWLFIGFCCQQSSGQCGSLELTSNQYTICQPALFKWVVKNAPAGSYYTWDFGNGIQPGQDTFYAFIQSAGKISVNVQVKFPNGSVCFINKSNFVEVFPKPIPTFYASRKKLCDGPDTITYFDITPNSIKRSWVIDGTNYYNATKKQRHSYASTGNKRLSLVVEDNKGCRAIKEFDSVAIIHKDVIVDFVADQTSGCISKSVNFTPNINTNGLQLISYKWSFPGGLPSEQFLDNPQTIQYDSVGKFSPSLEVKAINGCIHKLTKPNYLAFGVIDNLSLQLSDTAICRNGMIIIENLNKTLPGKFRWNLPGVSSIIQPDQYTCKAKYDTLGRFDVSVIYDYNGCTVSKFLSKAIRIKGVKADFISYDNYHCQLPHTVHFTNLSKSYEPGKLIYQWRIYDNTSKLIRVSGNVNDSFKVLQMGDYDVALITRHSNGCSDTSRQFKYIRNKEITPDFSAKFRVGCIGQFIEFLQATPPSTYKAPDKFKWTFYDKDGTKILGCDNSNNPLFAYPDTGFYSVKMVADNGIGCKDSITLINFIEIVKPELKFNFKDPIVCLNDPLMGYGTSRPANARFNYFWNFQHKTNGDFLYRKDSILDATLTSSGEYNFKLMHEINNGCRDSIVDNDLIKVNGVIATIDLDTINGCLPLIVKPNAIIKENYHFGNKDAGLKYKWRAFPSSNTIINGDTTATPVFTFNLSGQYVIHLDITNSTGCNYSISSSPIYVGIMADFEVSDYVVCANSFITLTDRSGLKPTKIKWLLEPDAITTDSLDQGQIKIKFDNRGTHKIGLIASKLNQCFDTLFQTVRSVIVKADMVALETEMKCAPVYAQFISNSEYADSLKWDFGDGNIVTTTDSFVANIYRKNSGSIKGFDLMLVAKSDEGCSDTLFKPNYVSVVGPVPEFELYNHTGCEPLVVEFKNKSKDVFKHYLNYDDGAPLDSSFGKHTYTIITPGLEIQQFQPRMYAIDSLGCKAEYESPVLVTVKNNTDAAFTVNDTVLCENQTMLYSDKALNVVSSAFYVNEKGMAPKQVTTPDVIFYKKGLYEFKQIVKNANGCADSLKIDLKVYSNPVAGFIMNDSVCLSRTLTFINKSYGDLPITNYYWEMLNPSSPVNYVTKNAKHIFNSTGPASVILTVKDVNGCQHSAIKNMTVPDPADIPPGDLMRVSVNADSSIVIHSKASSYNRFMTGNFYHTDNTELIRSISSRNEEQFDYYKPGISDASVCFDLKTVDVCGYESSQGTKHCTILLKVADAGLFTHQLNWTDYIGWPKLDNYNIYRTKQGESNYKLIATLAPSINSYIDSGLCHYTYTYFVQAAYNGLTSNSNYVGHAPLFVFPPAFKDVKNASVIAPNTIEVRWLPHSNTNFYDYLLYRTNVQTNKRDVINTVSNPYIDTDVNTDLYNYLYHVSETDKCGNQSQPVYEGKNIVLNATASDYTSFANWDTYKSWRSGVKEYNLQIEKNGSFKTIYTTANADSAFIHDQTLENIHGPYCYRIMAVSGDQLDTSFSNIACIISPSTLFFPNAFSPNGDQTNDKISVRSLFVYDNMNLSGRNFTLEIFNRWGERVYLSHSIDGEWDGVYMGKTVQTDVYTYKLKAMGVDNRGYSLKGTITVIP